MMHVHLVFVTKYRKNVLNGEILDVIKSSLNDVCIGFDSELAEFEGEDNHVHLLVNYPPKVQVSKLVNSLKGVSSRAVRKNFGKKLKDKLWGNALWSPSYFAGSCGGAPLEEIKKYIQNQDRPE
jgi:putative transposase